MSLELSFSGWWEGDAEYTCDNCFRIVKFPFDGQDIDYSEHRRELRKRGWISTRVNNSQLDFCCEKCRNSYIKKHT